MDMDRTWIFVGEEFYNEEERSFLELCRSKYRHNEVKGIFAKVVKNDTEVFERLFELRFSTESYRVPCWIWGEWITPFISSIWPENPKDNISRTLDTYRCNQWIERVLSEPFITPDFYRSHEGQLKDISTFEILMLIGNSKASGILSVARPDGMEAKFEFSKGYLQGAYARGIIGTEALYDFISWKNGIYVWKANDYDKTLEDYKINPPVGVLKILGEYHKLLRDNIHIFKIVNSFNTLIELKPSHCALDDPADPFFEHYTKICKMLSQQHMSIDSLIKLSTVSPLRTLVFVNRIISLGDATPIISEEPGSTYDSTYVARIDSFPENFPLKRHKVLVVDDAPFFLKVLSRMLEKDGRFEVVATAKDGAECLELLKTSDPDIITLDLEMPVLDGLSALKRIMIQNPKPVVVLSAFTGESSRMTYEAFKFGAVDVIEKPKNFTLRDMEQNTKEILDRVFRAANVQLEEIRYLRKSSSSYSHGVSSSTITSEDKIFVGILGSGSFSHFIKIMFLLDSIDWDAPVIFLTPIRFGALKELIKYIQMDCEKPMELVTQTPVPIRKGWFYICPQDIPSVVSTPDGGKTVFVHSKDDEKLSLVDSDKILYSLLASLWNVFGSHAIVSCISGLEEHTEVFEQYVRKGMILFYLDPSKCLYPGLSIKLRERNLGNPVKGLEHLIDEWQAITTVN